MTAILIFAIFVIVGDAISLGICSLVERISEPASVASFFVLFALVFWLAWRGAVFVTERYVLRQG